MYKSLEDVPSHVLQRVLDYNAAAVRLCTVGRNDWRIPSMIADQWLAKGYGTIDTNDFARRFGTTRRTACLALRRLTAAGIIRPIGATDRGKVMYAPVLSFADANRRSCGDAA